MSTMTLAPQFKQQFFDANGDPLALGKIYTYQAMSSTPQATYTDSGGGTANSNPVGLDANGECNLWLDPNLSYKFIVADADDVPIRTVDNVIGLLTVGAVNTASIQDGAVTTAKLADNAVTGAKLASDASLDVNRSVNTDHIKNVAVTPAKLSSSCFSSIGVSNLALSASVSGNALTINVLDAAGATPSANSPAVVPFRSSTPSTGTQSVRRIIASLSAIVPSGATLGHQNAIDCKIWVYLIDNAGTPELAVSSTLFDDGSVKSTTGLGASTSSSVMYSTVGRSNVPIRLIGRMVSNQSTAGTWTSVPSEISLMVQAAADSVNMTAVLATGYTTGANTPILYDTKLFDSHNRYNPATGLFTVPISGKYRVTASVLDSAGAHGYYISVSGSQLLAITYSIAGAAQNGSGTVPCVAGDTLAVEGSSSASLSGATPYTNYICIERVGD